MSMKSEKTLKNKKNIQGFKPQEVNHQQVLDEYTKAQNLAPKEKYRKMRSVATLAKAALNKATSLEEINLYSKIFKDTENFRLLSLAKSKEYELKGISNISTLKTKLGVVNIESGLIAVGDPLAGYQGSFDTSSVLERMNKGDFYCVGTGGDGSFDVTLRLVGVDEPLLGQKEYKFIVGNSKTALIKISSGFVKCADFWDLSRGKDPSNNFGVGYAIENGFYKVSFYLKNIPDRYFGFVAVLAKSERQKTEELTDIEVLG